MALSASEFEDLIREHASAMSAAIRRVCGRRHQALVADVEQEVQLALWKRLQGGNEIHHPASYIYKVALTTALSTLKRTRPDQVFPLDEEEDPVDVQTTGERLLPQEQARLLEEALEQLGGERERAVRAYLAGFNHREVARLFGWTESVARHRIYRSIEDLKRKLSPHDSD